MTKCVVQLLLIGITKDIIDRFLSQFSDEVHIFLNNNIDKLKESCQYEKVLARVI